MPAVFDSLVHSRSLTPHVAWRVAYIVPFILITSTALGMLFLCEDTPTGKWSDRHLAVPEPEPVSPQTEPVTPSSSDEQPEKEEKGRKLADLESISNGSIIDVSQGEVVVAPTLKNSLAVICSPHSLALAIPYAFSFGTSLLPFQYPSSSMHILTKHRRRARNKLDSRLLLLQKLPPPWPDPLRPMGRHVRAPQRPLPACRWHDRRPHLPTHLLRLGQEAVDHLPGRCDGCL